MKLIILVATFAFLTCINTAQGQKNKEKLPTDLNETKIVFLEYEPVSLSEYPTDFTKKYFESANEAFINTNKKLRDAASEYPFKYVISNRTDYETLVGEGCKYVLESDLMIKLNNFSFAPEKSGIYISDLYLMNILTGEQFPLFKISQLDAVNYKKVLAKFNKMVKKQYKTK